EERADFLCAVEREMSLADDPRHEQVRMDDEAEDHRRDGDDEDALPLRDQRPDRAEHSGGIASEDVNHEDRHGSSKDTDRNEHASTRVPNRTTAWFPEG